MASPLLESLRAAVAAMPPGALVPRDWLLEQLSGVSPTPSEPHSTPGALVDLTIGDLAQLFGKRPSTVRAWVERGDFPGTYKLHGREWRAPLSAVEAFRDSQRRLSGLSAWRAVKRQKVSSENGHDPVKKRSGSGNAED